MAIYTDWETQLEDYRGLFIFPSVTDSRAEITYPQVTIPLYIKEHSIPIRKPKITEVNTITNTDPNTAWETSSSLLFYGVNDPLTVVLSGFIITPVIDYGAGRIWEPTEDGSMDGTPLGLTGVSNVDLISAYIEGRMNRNRQGRWVRTDPDAYVDPFGHKYNNPVLVIWEPSYTAVHRKQAFSATLYLET